MRPTYTKSGTYQGLSVYQSVIVHSDGREEVLEGPPLANGITATKYAAIEVGNRLRKKRRHRPQPGGRPCVITNLGDTTKTRLFYRDGTKFETHNASFAYFLYCNTPKGVKIAFRSAGDKTPVYSWDYVDRNN